MAKSVKRMTDREFVETYMAAKSADDAAKAMGCTINNVYSRRRKLKGEGVELPDFPKTVARGEKDVVGLNALIASLKNKPADGGGETETAKTEGETAKQGETVSAA